MTSVRPGMKTFSKEQPPGSPPSSKPWKTPTESASESALSYPEFSGRFRLLFFFFFMQRKLVALPE